jgi:hypothetical protein
VSEYRLFTHAAPPLKYNMACGETMYPMRAVSVAKKSVLVSRVLVLVPA